MTAEARASSRVTPFPCDTESVRASGRTQSATGIPIRSRPVTSATLVIPTVGRIGLIRAKVSAASHARKVPPRSRFSAAGRDRGVAKQTFSLIAPIHLRDRRTGAVADGSPVAVKG